MRQHKLSFLIKSCTICQSLTLPAEHSMALIQSLHKIIHPVDTMRQNNTPPDLWTGKVFFPQFYTTPIRDKAPASAIHKRVLPLRWIFRIIGKPHQACPATHLPRCLSYDVVPNIPVILPEIKWAKIAKCLSQAFRVYRLVIHIMSFHMLFLR